MEVSGQHHAPATLPREITAVPIEQKAGWAPMAVGRFGEHKYLLPLLGFELRTAQPVASTILTTLSRLQ